MFERSADAILLLDTRSNHFVAYNQAALKMLGCTQEELNALHPSALSPPTQEDGRESFEKANEMIDTAVRQGSHRFEWIHCSPHRADFPVEVLLTPIQVGDAPVLQVVWRDITERRETEAALRLAQRLESVGVLAGGIAHDFNNLLAAVLGHLDLARAQLAWDDPVAIHLLRADHAVQKAADLTRQLLAYSGRGTFLVQPMDLSRSVEEIAELLSVSVPRHIRMVTTLAPRLPAILGDRAQVQQIILNLVTNAAEAIGAAEGSIRLRTGVRDLDEAALQADLPGQGVAPGLYVALEVRDDGCGMTPETLARIFDPFFSTKQPGRGLGMSALRGILRTHHGGIHLVSAPGRGTTITVYLPATTAAPPPDIPLLPVATPRERRGLALLVEDEEMVRASSRAMLERLGYEVVEAANGEEALQAFDAHRDSLTFVLMDLTMPVMDGRAAFVAMRRVAPDVRVILTSGWSESALVDRFIEAPPSAFLTKPFGLREVDAALRRAGLGVRTDSDGG